MVLLETHHTARMLEAQRNQTDKNATRGLDDYDHGPDLGADTRAVHYLMPGFLRSSSKRASCVTKSRYRGAGGNQQRSPAGDRARFSRL
jgi:hypothetical protein